MVLRVGLGRRFWELDLGDDFGRQFWGIILGDVFVRCFWETFLGNAWRKALPLRLATRSTLADSDSETLLRANQWGSMLAFLPEAEEEFFGDLCKSTHS